MFYKFKLDGFPVITKFYTVVRNTVWGITETDNILITVTDGTCNISCDGETYQIKKGDAFFIPAGHYYERIPIDNKLCTMIYIHFSFEGLGNNIIQTEADDLKEEITKLRDRLDSKLIDGDSYLSHPSNIYICNKNVFPDFKEAVDAIKKINLYSANRQLMCGLQSSINLCRILTLLSQATIDKMITGDNIHTETGVPRKLKKAVGYITRHYSEQITLEQLASYCNISKQQLIRYFKHCFGDTPINYINDYKLSRAKELLFYSPNLLISEIAAELGFNSQYYFTKLFKKRMGETPSEYRYRTINYEQNHKQNDKQNYDAAQNI